jgi:hypothetical protein
MAEHLRDFRHGRATPDHLGGQAVSEQVGNPPRPGTHARAAKREAHNVIDRTRTREADAWRDEPEKYPS